MSSSTKAPPAMRAPSPGISAAASDAGISSHFAQLPVSHSSRASARIAERAPGPGLDGSERSQRAAGAAVAGQPPPRRSPRSAAGASAAAGPSRAGSKRSKISTAPKNGMQHPDEVEQALAHHAGGKPQPRPGDALDRLVVDHVPGRDVRPRSRRQRGGHQALVHRHPHGIERRHVVEMTSAPPLRESCIGSAIIGRAPNRNRSPGRRGCGAPA